MRNKALYGALAEIASWLISLPFLPHKTLFSIADVKRAAADPSTGFTLGTFYGWFSHGLLGLLAGLLIALVYSWNKPLLTRVRSCFIGAFLGAIWVCGADAGSDYLGITICRSLGHDLSTDIMSTTIWSALMSTGLCSALICSMGMHKDIVSRLFMTILLSSGAALILRYIADFVIAIIAAIILVQGNSVNTWAFSAPGFLVSDVVIASVVGACLAVAERLTRQAWLRLTLGRNEGNTWTIDGENTRIGSQEGLEVRVPYDPAISPVHAMIQRRESNYALIDYGSQTGVLLNGQPVQTAWLKHQDSIQIGPYVFEFSLRNPGSQVTPRYMPKPVGQAAEVSKNTLPRTGATTASLNGQPSQSTQTANLRSSYGPAGGQTNPELIVRKLVDSMGNGHMVVPGTMTIGRDQSCDIAITWDPSVSRRHIELAIDAASVTIRDLGSKNGTRVNSNPITDSVVLNDGDVIEAGNAKLTFAVEQDAPEQM